MKPVPNGGEDVTASFSLDLLDEDGEDHVEAGPEGAKPETGNRFSSTVSSYILDEIK